MTDDDAPQAPPIALGLRRIRPPEHHADFWSDLDRRLADEPQLRLAPRAAIRPITQPPPVVDDRHLAKTLAGGTTDVTPPRRSGGKTLLTALVAGVLALLIAVAIVQDPDDGTATDDEAATDTSTGRTPTSDEAAAPPTQPTTTLPPGAVDPAAPLDPAGVGPLRIGATLGELQAAGVLAQHDQATFRGSGGTCYDAKVAGALDLRLRFRNAEGTRRAEDPTEGVLVAIGIESALPTTRVSAGTAIGLGTPQDQVLAAYAGNLDERDHPFVPAGKIFRADAGNGLGIGFVTDGTIVTGITVGQMDVIRFINDCR